MTIHFPDVSHYQAGLSLVGAPFAVAKATQGTLYVDPSYAGFRDQADQLGIGFAAYHWVDTTDLALQAAHAYSVAAGRPMMWDAEAAGATVGRLVELTSRLRALGGNPRSVYLPHWFWQSLGSPSLTPLVQAGLFLISSNYPPGGYTDTGPGWAPYGGMTPQVWQYTSTQLFNGKRCDFNAFKGSLDALHALWGLNVPDPSPSGDLDMPAIVIATDGTDYYACQAPLISRKIVPPAGDTVAGVIGDIIYLAKPAQGGSFTIAQPTGTPNPLEWVSFQLPGNLGATYVRLGWSEAIFGPLYPSPSGGGGGSDTDPPAGPYTISLTGSLSGSMSGTATPTA